jgi:hypothetical protein
VLSALGGPFSHVTKHIYRTNNKPWMMVATTIADIQAAARQRQIDVFLSEQPDNTVQQMYNRFMKWIDETPDLSSDASGSYISRYNVDQYFLRSIPTRGGKASYLRKNDSSLQWYVKYHEQVHLVPGEQLVICNDTVTQGLAMQVIYQRTNLEGVNRESWSRPALWVAGFDLNPGQKKTHVLYLF